MSLQGTSGSSGMAELSTSTPGGSVESNLRFSRGFVKPVTGLSAVLSRAPPSPLCWRLSLSVRNRTSLMPLSVRSIHGVSYAMCSRC